MAAGAGGASPIGSSAQGHKVFTPTLTGLGERSHLLSTSINLDTHITDIVNVFKWEDLRDACLVVHSYGGWPGSGRARTDRRPRVVDRLARRVQAGERRTRLRHCVLVRARRHRGRGRARRTGRPAPDVQAFGVNEADRAWVTSKLTPQPTGVYLPTIKLTGAREKVAKKTYIRAPRYPQPGFDKAYADCKADKTWQTFETTTAGHDVMVDDPQWLADILLKVS